ncbi:MAG: TlyA family RNA methyltransferase [Rhizomicrobium sp.]|jgi:23S rRNA (cytidine1920-2'-O)/16S rRNA (cytidine1409-2'-O)-methyltransferase
MTPRADVFLVEQGYAASRAQAQAAIRAGKVYADGQPVLKSSQTIAQNASIEYEKAHPYVSRGALKLAAALDRFALSPAGLVCIDVGASTGGFTDVLLRRSARKVYAVDVGHGQLHPKLAADPRVILLEGVNARDLGQAQVPEQVDAIVADVSFVGLKLVLPAALKLAHKGAWLIALIKPQFEAGVGKVGKGGIVKDKSVQEEALQGIVDWLGAQPGWSVIGTMDSPITGGDGNREFLIAAGKP